MFHQLVEFVLFHRIFEGFGIVEFIKVVLLIWSLSSLFFLAFRLWGTQCPELCPNFKMNILLLVWPIETFPQPSQCSIFDLYFFLFLIIQRLLFHPNQFARLLNFELFFIIFILFVLQSHPSLFQSTFVFLYQTTADSLS